MSEQNSRPKKSTNLKIRQRRIFSEEFKREKVQEIISGHQSIGSFCKLWSVSNQSELNWTLIGVFFIIRFVKLIVYIEPYCLKI